MPRVGRGCSQCGACGATCDGGAGRELDAMLSGGGSSAAPRLGNELNGVSDCAYTFQYPLKTVRAGIGCRLIGTECSIVTNLVSSSSLPLDYY